MCRVELTPGAAPSFVLGTDDHEKPGLPSEGAKGTVASRVAEACLTAARASVGHFEEIPKGAEVLEKGEIFK